MLKILTVFVGLALFVASAYAEEDVLPPPLLVITDLRPVGSEASIAEARSYSEYMRQELERSGLFRVISRSSMQAILKAKSFKLPCYKLPCFSSMGKLLGADQVLAGYLKRDGDGIDITLRVIDVKKRQFLNMVHQTKTSLRYDALLGKWGRNLVCQAFEIDPETLKASLQDENVMVVSKTRLPDSITQKYPGMIYIPKGKATIGSLRGDPCEMPTHSVDIDAFYIGQFEVTNRDYAEFLKATQHPAPSYWEGERFPQGMEKHPVTWISFEDAEAYCLWSGGRLPTENEWEYAARGNGQRIFPWGNEFSTRKGNVWETNRQGTAPVGSFPLGASPFGVEDMAGNVFEWVDGFFVPYPGSSVRLKEFDQHMRILRGGSWNFGDYYARTTHRFPRAGGEKKRSYGFRMVRDL